MISRKNQHGRIFRYIGKNFLLTVEAKTNTDFNAKSNTFSNFFKEILNLIISYNKKSLYNFIKSSCAIHKIVEKYIKVVKEEILITRIVELHCLYDETISSYIHTSNNRLLSYVILKNSTMLIKKYLSMHIIALKPSSLSSTGLKKTSIEIKINKLIGDFYFNGNRYYMNINVINKQLYHYIQSNVLLNQPFIIGGKQITSFYDFQYIKGFAIIEFCKKIL